jgi:hypothetical protein
MSIFAHLVFENQEPDISQALFALAAFREDAPAAIAFAVAGRIAPYLP